MGKPMPAGNHTHYHVGRPHEKCSKIVRPAAEVTARQCGQKRDAPVHRFYTCLHLTCTKRLYSIEHRLQHMERDHG